MCSQFQLKHEATYSQHPNLVQYFLPFTDAEFQERLEQHKAEIAIMLRSSEFNQDKTALIVTNNPLPLFISGQQLSTPFQFFPEDIRRKSQPDSDHLPPVNAQNSQLSPSIRKLRKPAEFRFSRDKDFTSEAHFSKNYAERRLLRMYPQLRKHMRLGTSETEPLPSIQGWSPNTTYWEPLTISCLTETRRTINVPGEDGFRYGRAPLWIVDSSVVPKYAK
ncbi:testis-specific gene 13 protein [Zootoca vivipara]|uniref:testis-specific gene 13 protein n=1 Tax=Zootoca vivipara TaxID=8524 RepID=UPI00293BAAEF|nr:testis-specific gene 13 protein [Zootoca vivipara]XP_060135214.1 testis-specific gene 13 protein [Zootoca vivipara]XP_060135215.1 testis-specific gene 13 protein [Zootoca vivipara]XP_060135216.1 testis-specific gene 13 protein [Zootoca vivipara]